MTLDQLRVFVTVAQHLNMRRAAEILNLSQPAVSAAIAALENRNRVRLFHRIGRRLELTEAGLMFQPEAQAVLLRMEDAKRSLSDFAGLECGTLRLAASQTVATYWVPRRMARFATLHPRIKLSLDVGNTAQTVTAVLSGAAELGFIEGHVDDTDIITRDIGGDHVGLYCAADHPLVDVNLNLRHIRDAAWILREEGSGTRDHFVTGMSALGLDLGDLDIRLELPSNGAVLNAVMIGDFVCAVSDLAAESRLKAGMVHRLNYELPPRQFRMVFHRQRYLSQAAQAFTQLSNSKDMVPSR